MTIRVPFTPPRFCPTAPCGGVIGPDPEHFVVEEIPAYPLSGEGEHLFIWIEKVGRNTQDVAKALARAAEMKDRDVGYAGMKDKNAITRQWFSLCTKKEDPQAWELGEGIRVLSHTRHGNKLRTGHLIGNRFSIGLLGVDEAERKRAAEIAHHLNERGLPNYFGPQRFGRGGSNLSRALEWLEGAANERKPPERPERRNRRKKGKGRFENKLFPSVIQSEVFNRYLAARLERPEALLLGEVVRLDNTGTTFVVEDLARETPRYEAGDLHLTGPMIGPKGMQARDEARALEMAICSDLGLDEGALTTLAKSAPGTRRDLMLHPEGLEVVPSSAGLTLHFSLPAGAYATQVIREFSGANFMEPRGEVTSTDT